MYPIRGIAPGIFVACWARAASGHAAAPPSAATKSRRLMALLRCCAASLDHLVGMREQGGRNLEPESPGGLEVDGEVKNRGLLNRQIGRFRALQYFVDE